MCLKLQISCTFRPTSFSSVTSNQLVHCFAAKSTSFSSVTPRTDWCTVFQLHSALGSRARACNSNFSTLATGMVLQGVFEMSYFVHHTQSSASCMYGMVTSKDAKLQHPARDGCQSFIAKAKQPSPGAAAWSKCKTRVPQAGTETGRPRL